MQIRIIFNYYQLNPQEPGIRLLFRGQNRYLSNKYCFESCLVRSCHLKRSNKTENCIKTDVKSRKSGLRGGRVGVEFASEGVEKKRKKRTETGINILMY